MQKQYFLFLLCLGIIFSCNATNSDQKNLEVKNDLDKSEIVKNKDVIKDDIPKNSTTVDNLKNYFKKLDVENYSESYSSCHSEKGIYTDWFEAKTIPANLVKQYKLYKFQMSPYIGGKYKYNNPAVEVKGYYYFEKDGYTYYIYGVGIEKNSEQEPEMEGLEARVAIIDQDDKLVDSYLIGGTSKEKNFEEKNLCREFILEGNEIIFTIDRSTVLNEPSHLRLKEVEKYSLPTD